VVAALAAGGLRVTARSEWVAVVAGLLLMGAGIGVLLAGS
jgi:hypothetical protein